MTDVTVFFLEMTSPGQLRRSTSATPLKVVECLVKQGKVNRFLYDLVGEPWQWFDRRDWSVEQWEEYAGADDLRTFLALQEGSIAGYFELKKRRLDTEIAYFGLAPPFTGRGLGGSFLTEAVDCAWQWSETNRVILNTCTLDHPSALNNYRKRGFKIYRECGRAATW